MKMGLKDPLPPLIGGPSSILGWARHFYSPYPSKSQEMGLLWLSFPLLKRSFSRFFLENPRQLFFLKGGVGSRPKGLNKMRSF